MCTHVYIHAGFVKRCRFLIRDIHMEGGAAAEQICFTCISLVNERAVLNPQSLHSLAKIFALVEPPSNGGEYAND